MVEETTFRKFKKGIIELLRGYPDYKFFGKIEYYLKNEQSSIKILERDKIIELAPRGEEELLNKKLSSELLLLLKNKGKEKPDCWYRLTSKGVDLAISMINLEHSEKVLKHSQRTIEYSQEMKKFTKVIIYATILGLIVSFTQLIKGLWT
jgi:hypothetical protein